MSQPLPFRLLSFNIQAGLDVQRYHHYLTGAWRHALPTPGRRANLLAMAALMRDYDFVAIQEADAGSIRTDQVNLVDFLAEQAGFPYSGLTVTRDFAPIARVCIGYLSKSRPLREVTHVLPGRIRGRGALEVDLDTPALGHLTVLVTHLALRAETRNRQLAYLSELLRGQRGMLVGDLNMSPDRLLRLTCLRRAGLAPVPGAPATYPSWRPRRSIDQILMTPHLQLLSVRALPVQISDHLPLAAELIARP